MTAADAESYIPDRRTAEPAPRVGNESTVAGAEVVARYYGRPSLAVADLDDVRVVTLKRQAGTDERVAFRPADYAPPGDAVSSRMLLERLSDAGQLDWSRASLDSAAVAAKRGVPRPARTRRIAANRARSAILWSTAGAPRPGCC